MYLQQELSLKFFAVNVIKVYINGAAADPPPITRIPNKSKTKSMGIIKTFFFLNKIPKI